MATVELLRRVPLFARLTDQELGVLASSMVRRTFRKGVYIFHKDSPGQALYLIESGKVRIFVLCDSGQEVSIEIFGPGEIFGELALLDGLPRSASAVTVEDTVALLLHRDDFGRHLDSCPRIGRAILEVLSARIRRSTATITNLAFLDVSGRVALKLLELADRYGLSRTGTQGEEIELALTQAELASWVATSRESINRVLNMFRDQGLIEVTGHNIVVLDRHGLTRYVAY